MSAPLNLEELVDLLAPKVAAKLRLQEDALLTVPEFCTINKISRSTWFAMKRDGTGPRTISVGRTGAQERISVASIRERPAK